MRARRTTGGPYAYKLPVPVMRVVIHNKKKSSVQKITPPITATTSTTSVVWIVSSFVGHTTLLSSTRAPCTNFHSALPCIDVSATTAASATASSTPRVRSSVDESPK